jgi:hypothetical protein
MKKRTKPQYGRAGRSAAFRAWLETQTPERKREIAAQESAWLATQVNRDAYGENPQERAFLDSMEGYEDKPAGITERYVSSGDHEPLLSLVPGYQPKRSVSE